MKQEHLVTYMLEGLRGAHPFLPFHYLCHFFPMSSSSPSLNLSHHDKMKTPFEGLHTHRRVTVLVTVPLCQKDKEFKEVVLSESDLTFLITCRYYTKARDVLHHYSHMPSFHGIHQDCDEIVKQLIVQLREQLRNPKVSSSFAWACFQFESFLFNLNSNLKYNPNTTLTLR